MSTSVRASGRGSGRIFKPKNSVNWHASFYRFGKEIRESTGIPFLDPDPKDVNRKKALAFLKQRVDATRAESAGGPQLITPQKRRITVGQLLDGLKADYEARGVWSAKVASNVKPVREYFGHMSALAVSKNTVSTYIAKLREDEYTAASINRRLQLLTQAYRIGELSPPKVTRLSEVGNERKGFFEKNEFLRVLAHLPAHLQPMCRFAYITGWRRGALATLTWDDVDAEKVYLRAIHSKNRRPVTVPLIGELAEIIAECRKARTIKNAHGEAVRVPFVFHNKGQQIGDFRKSWKTACKQAGVNRLFHDMRRSAARNLVLSGTPESVAMSVTGHLTASMFRRYSIVSEQQKQAALSAVAMLPVAQPETEQEVTIQ